MVQQFRWEIWIRHHGREVESQLPCLALATHPDIETGNLAPCPIREDACVPSPVRTSDTKIAYTFFHKCTMFDCGRENFPNNPPILVPGKAPMCTRLDLEPNACCPLLRCFWKQFPLTAGGDSVGSAAFSCMCTISGIWRLFSS